ncbi:hypothetical protein ABID52_001994 [Fictibacillus halophilus]|uniref:Uncharacterized protein n=1 Tax=Fictibacillus halophilus TaxID=1610490 RepID=A0ABV2LIJ3_9BACL
MLSSKVTFLLENILFDTKGFQLIYREIRGEYTDNSSIETNVLLL